MAGNDRREDERRFAAFYRRTFTPLVGYAARRCQSTEDAADLVAETYLVAWRRFEAVPEGPAGLWWLYATARRLQANRRRGEARRRAAVTRLAVEIGVRAAADAGPGAERLSDREAFLRLSRHDREILCLVGWEGLDADGLAAVLGCSANAARLALHRARARLEKELSREPPAARLPVRPTVLPLPSLP
jgi:RNA polymerase sigma-70 factor (ECF subfamily)